MKIKVVFIFCKFHRISINKGRVFLAVLGLGDPTVCFFKSLEKQNVYAAGPPGDLEHKAIAKTPQYFVKKSP